MSNTDRLLIELRKPRIRATVVVDLDPEGFRTPVGWETDPMEILSRSDINVRGGKVVLQTVRVDLPDGQYQLYVEDTQDPGVTHTKFIDSSKLINKFHGDVE